MSKRIAFIACLALILALLASGASARTLVSYGDEEIYVGDNGYPYQADTLDRYLSTRVRQSLYRYDDIYCFSQTDSYGRQTLKTAVSDYDAGRISTKSIAVVAFDPVYCQYDGVIYYVTNDSRNVVMSFNPKTERKIVAYRSTYDIDGLMDSVNGLLICDDGAYFLYEARRKTLTDLTYDPTDSTIRVFGDCQVELTVDGEMYVLRRGEEDRELVTQSGAAAWRMDDDIYYTQSFSTSARLSRYDLDAGRSYSLYRVYEKIAPSIVALDGVVYMTTDSGEALSYDVASKTLDTVSFTEAGGAHLETAGENILMYEDTDEGAFIGILEQTPPEPEYETLKRGSRGDGVTNLQEKLAQLGYLTSSVDGVFGSGTEKALRLLQFDMGQDDNGIASPDFQREIFENGAPSYKQYVTLRSGTSGIRIEEMVTRLRDLYYTKRAAGDTYDEDIVEAVERFQARMSYRENGNTISASQLKALMRSGARECDTYYELERYDSAPVVKRLNKRLKALGYLSSSHVNENFSIYTVRALKKFQDMIYFEPTGIADPDTQYELFSTYAPTPSPDPTPEPTPEPYPTPEPTYGPLPNQAVKEAVISTMRTWMKNNLGGSFPKDLAIYTLQSRLADLGFLEDGDINSVYDHVTKVAVENFQSENNLNVNGNANKKTLAALFLDFEVYG